MSMFKKEGKKPKLICTNAECKYEREIVRQENADVTVK